MPFSPIVDVVLPPKVVLYMTGALLDEVKHLGHRMFEVAHPADVKNVFKSWGDNDAKATERYDIAKHGYLAVVKDAAPGPILVSREVLGAASRIGYGLVAFDVPSGNWVVSRDAVHLLTVLGYPNPHGAAEQFREAYAAYVYEGTTANLVSGAIVP